MGSCVGRCLPHSNTTSRFHFSNQNSGPDFTNLIEEHVPVGGEGKKYLVESLSHNIIISCSLGCRSFVSRLFSKRKERKKPKKPVLELVEDIFSPPGDSYCRLSESQGLANSSSYNSRDIPLQCLDARALLAQTTNSTPASSLDLEWEHETIPISMMNDPSGSSWVILSEDYTEPCPSESSAHHSLAVRGTNSEWSRVSSADSLEWDSVNNSFHASPPEIDTDTQMLLSEIERLTSQALKETGQTIFS